MRTQAHVNAGRKGGVIVSFMHRPADAPSRYELLRSVHLNENERAKARKWTPRRSQHACES